MSKISKEILNKIKSGSLSVQNVSKETGIPASRIYKWKERDSDISAEDAEKLDNWGKTLDTPDIKKDTLDKDVLKMVAQSNLNQSEANKNQSIANRKLAESISVLTHQFTGGGSSEIREEMAQKFGDLILIIQKLATGQPIDEDLSTFWSVEKSKSVSSDNSLAG